MLYEILIIIVCMFACIGITELSSFIFTRLCISRLPCKFYILADNFEKEDAECVIRFLENVISKSDLDCTVCGIRLSENAKIDDEVLEMLNREFGNIEKESTKGEKPGIFI